MNEQDDLILDFDTSTAVVGDVDSYDVLPAGRYDAIASEVKTKPTKDGNGKRLCITWTIIGDDLYKGRKVFDWLNVYLPGKEEATKIGHKQIGNRLSACGLDGERDMGKIIGREATLSIKVRPAGNGFDAQNEINKAFPIGGQSAPRSVPAGLESDSSAIGQGGKSPGAKKPPPFMRK